MKCQFNNDIEILNLNITWNRKVMEPLDPRDALFGGRIEPTNYIMRELMS